MDDFAGKVGGRRGRLRRKSRTARLSIPTWDFRKALTRQSRGNAYRSPKVGAARRAAPRFRREAPSLRDKGAAAPQK
jgi:hypothetical protein